MAEFPAFPLWTDAYLADTGHLSTIEHGAYLLLLMTMWRAGGKLPNDDKRIARYTRLSAGQWERMKPVIMEFFTVDGDEITQGRLSDELVFVRQRSKTQSENARAKSRKTKDHAQATAKPNSSQTSAPTPTPTPIEKKEPSVHKKGARLSEDWRPDQDWAKSCGLPVETLKREYEKFRDYFMAESGQKAVKLDWEKTWRNWIRRVIERAPAKKESVGDYAYRKMMETKNAATSNSGSAGLFEDGDARQRSSGLSLLEDLANSKD